jgi:serine/threonine protein kinase
VDNSIGFRQVPEPFAWYLLYRLVSAAVVMDTAFRTDETHYQVAHCDFKPDNIFLGAPGCLGKNNSFPAYPPAYLGDFGNAHITYPGDPNQHMMYGMCTPGWSAPEITKLGHVKEPWQAPGGSHTVREHHTPSELASMSCPHVFERGRLRISFCYLLGPC